MGKKITQHIHIRYFDVWYVTDDDFGVGVAPRVGKKKITKWREKESKGFLIEIQTNSPPFNYISKKSKAYTLSIQFVFGSSMM
jgi:hypothetical protein